MVELHKVEQISTPEGQEEFIVVVDVAAVKAAAKETAKTAAKLAAVAAAAALGVSLAS